MKKLAIALALMFPLTLMAGDKDKVLSFTVNQDTKVFITNNKCPADYKDKYPLVAFAVNSYGTKILKGCWQRRLKDDFIVIHWHNTPDTIEANSELPADFFLVDLYRKEPAKQEPVQKEPEVKI